MDKIINILETIGCVCIAASFFFFSYKYQVANALFWGGLLLVLPRIVQKNFYEKFTKQIIVGICLILLIYIGSIFFTKPKVEIKLPILPTITIHRS